MTQKLATRTFVLAFVANFFHNFAFDLYLHLPAFAVQLGASEVEIGWLMGVLAASAIVSRPWIGRIIDRHGRRGALLLGGVLHGLACTAYVFIDRVGPALYAVRVVHGVAEALLISALFTIAVDVAPRERLTQALALFGISGMLPLSLAGLLGDWILARADFSTLFISTAALALVGCLVSLPVKDSAEVTIQGGPTARSASTLLRDRRIVSVYVLGLAFSVGLASYFTFLKTYLLTTGVGSMGWFFTTYSLAAIALRLLFGWLPDRLGPKRVVLPILGGMAVGLVLLGFGTSNLLLVAAGLLCGAGHGFAFPILSALAVARASIGERGIVVSLYTAMFDAGIFLGGPLFGFIAEMTNYAVMFVAAGFVVAAGTLWFAYADRDRLACDMPL